MEKTTPDYSMEMGTHISAFSDELKRQFREQVALEFTVEARDQQIATLHQRIQVLEDNIALLNESEFAQEKELLMQDLLTLGNINRELTDKIIRLEGDFDEDET